MGILDNAKYAELGKKAEAKQLADIVVKSVKPSIEKEVIRKAAPVIEQDTINRLVTEIANAKAVKNNINPTQPVGLSNYKI